MRKGDLVRVRWGGTANSQEDLGEVLDYRPDVLGGSWGQSYRRGGQVINEFLSEARRGQVLVLTYDDGAAAWWDENNVEAVTDGS
jgi:hypothetical protein